MARELQIRRLMHHAMRQLGVFVLVAGLALLGPTSSAAVVVLSKDLADTNLTVGVQINTDPFGTGPVNGASLIFHVRPRPNDPARYFAVGIQEQSPTVPHANAVVMVLASPPPVIAGQVEISASFGVQNQNDSCKAIAIDGDTIYVGGTIHGLGGTIHGYAKIPSRTI